MKNTLKALVLVLALCLVLTGLTYSTDAEALTFTIEWNSAEALCITNTGSSTLQFENVEIIY